MLIFAYEEDRWESFSVFLCHRHVTRCNLLDHIPRWLPLAVTNVRGLISQFLLPLSSYIPFELFFFWRNLTKRFTRLGSLFPFLLVEHENSDGKFGLKKTGTPCVSATVKWWTCTRIPFPSFFFFSLSSPTFDRFPIRVRPAHGPIKPRSHADNSRSSIRNETTRLAICELLVETNFNETERERERCRDSRYNQQEGWFRLEKKNRNIK